jgi:thymidylate kinase
MHQHSTLKPAAATQLGVDAGEAIGAAGQILLRVCEVLDRAGIAYCLLHGYENYPHRIESDVDLVIESRLTPDRLVALLRDHKASVGADVIMRRGHCVVMAGSSPGSTVTLDFAVCCEADGIILYDGAPLLASRRRHREFWIPQASLEFACGIARAVAKSRLDQARGAKLNALYLQDPAGCLGEIARFWRGPHHDLIVSAVRSGDWGKVCDNLDSIRSELRKRMIRNAPIQHLAGFVWRALDRVRRLWQPEGVTAVLLGPDGAGKSSVIAALPHRLSETLPHSACWGFAPPLHRLLGRKRGSTDQPHLLSPRGAFASMVRAAYWLVYALLSQVVLRVVLARAALVMYDRHFVDILVDARRYRYGGPDWVLQWVWRLMPKPDLVILLDAPAEILQQRKQEVPLAVTVRQRDAYLALVRSIPNGHIVDADQSREAVTDQVARVVLRYLAGRVADRAPA